MKKVILCLTIIFCVTLLTGCGNSLKKYAGTYKLEYTKFVGDQDTAKRTNEYGEIVLNDDGTGESTRDGVIFNIDWSIDGNNITIREQQAESIIEYNGTINTESIDLYNGDKTNNLTIESFYVKK